MYDRRMTPKEAIEKLKAAGWSQVQIAKYLDMTPANIYRINTGSEPNYAAGRKLVLAASRRLRPPKRVSV